MTVNSADIGKIREAALRVLTELSTAARLAGDDRNMYAANRAWNELYNLQREDAGAARRAKEKTKS